MASRHLRKQLQLQRRLAGDLVQCQTEIDPATENFDTAVRRATRQQPPHLPTCEWRDGAGGGQALSLSRVSFHPTFA